MALSQSQPPLTLEFLEGPCPLKQMTQDSALQGSAITAITVAAAIVTVLYVAVHCLQHQNALCPVARIIPAWSWNS